MDRDIRTIYYGCFDRTSASNRLFSEPPGVQASEAKARGYAPSISFDKERGNAERFYVAALGQRGMQSVDYGMQLFFKFW